MPHATVDADAHVPQHTRVAEPLVPGGLMQPVPLAHMLPKPEHMRHAEEGIASPHATLPAEGQFAQQVPPAPPVHDVPDPQLPVPKPVQARQIAPPASRTSGIRVPQGTDEGSAHPPQQVRSVAPPGRSTQAVPLPHMLPVPLQVRHTAPEASRASGMSTPHATLPAPGQRGQQSPSMQSLPDAQRVPSPVQIELPMQVAGIATPQSTMPAERQSSVQVHAPATQVRSRSHGPVHGPPHPSGAPHTASGAQLGMHSHKPVSGLHSS